MATYRNTNPESDLFEKVKRYIGGLGLYTKPAGGIPASDLAGWVLPSAVTDYSVGGLGYTKNEGTVTGAKMNNGFELLPDENGVVDLGSVVTDDSGKADKSAAIGSLSLSLDSTNFKITLSGAKCDGTTFTVSNVIDLPLESVVVNGSYDNSTKKVILTLQNGSTVEFSVADLVSGLQSEITSSNKLSADLVDDASATNKFTNASEKSTWSGKQDALVSGTNIKTINNESLLGSGNISISSGGTQVQADWNQTDNTQTDYIKNKPTLGTASALDVASSGNASSSQVVKGNDTRLTDARTPTSHTHTVSQITDFPTIPDAQIQSDWNQSDNTKKDYIKNKPSIPAEQIQADWNQSNSSAKDYIKNKPTIPVVPTLATVATSGDYGDLINKPTIPTVPTNVSAFTNDAGYLTQHQDISGKANSNDLATVAFSGSYTDLDDKPTIPTVPTNVSAFTNDAGYITTETEPDFNNSAAASITSTDITAWNGKSTFSGSYNDLTDKPTLFSGAYADLTGKPNFATVATSGDYDDLTNKPTIPAAVTESTVSGWGFTKNAGTITGITMNGASKGTSGVVDLGTVITSHQDISGKANTADLAAVATSGSYTDLSDKPTIPTVPTNVSAFTNDAGYTTNTGTVTSTGGTVAVNNIQVVSALPASPDTNTLYLITGS